MYGIDKAIRELAQLKAFKQILEDRASQARALITGFPIKNLPAILTKNPAQSVANRLFSNCREAKRASIKQIGIDMAIKCWTISGRR